MNNIPVFVASESASIITVSPGALLEVPWDPGFLHNRQYPATELIDSGSEAAGSVSIDFSGKYVGTSPVSIVAVQISTNDNAAACASFNISISAPSLAIPSGRVTIEGLFSVPVAGASAMFYGTLAFRQSSTNYVVPVEGQASTSDKLQVNVTNLPAGCGATISAYTVFPGSSHWEDYLRTLKVTLKNKLSVC